MVYVKTSSAASLSGEIAKMPDVVREAQGAHLCALFIKAHGDTGDYEYALNAANSAATHLQGNTGGTV